MATEPADIRHKPCYILRENDIPSVIWCEDAVGYYGVPTVVFNFHILVADIDKAAEILIQRGWVLEDSAQSKFGNFPLRSAHRRLMPPASMIQTKASWYPKMAPPSPPSELSPRPLFTILFPASDWEFPFPTTDQYFFPPLPSLVDALIDKLLDDPLTDGIWLHLAVLIGYLYEYVPALKEKSFAQHLKYDHRQYHYDCLAGMSTGTLPFVRHQREIRNAFREGKLQLCDCSADKEDESLFQAKVIARLKASMGLTCSPEQYEADKKREIEEELKSWSFD